MLKINGIRIKTAILIWTLLINAIFILFVVQQIKTANEINETWKNHTLNSIEQAMALIEIEREIGYLGYIHHFKNYILRGDDQYYQRAKQSHQKALNFIDNLKKFIFNTEQLNALFQLKTTIDLYHEKLELAKINKSLPIKSIDLMVKVDDEPALFALKVLRDSIALKAHNNIQYNDNLLAKKRKLTLIFSLSLLPFFIFGSIYFYKLVSRLSKVKNDQQLIFDTMADGIIFSDHNGKIIRNNKSAEQIFGYSSHEMQNLHIEDLIERSIREAHTELRSEFHLKEQSRFMKGNSSAVFGLKKNGEHVDLSIAISSKKQQDEMYSVAIIRDTTKDNEIKKHSEIDHLTTINNRRAIEQKINHELSRSDRNDHVLSVMLVDIDKFKDLNDKLGHLAGDSAIKKVVKLIQDLIRDYDHFGRWGGDEFLIACPNLNAEDSIIFAQRLCNEAADTLWEADMRITISIGITTYADKNITYDELIKNADGALYYAKNNGRNQVAHSDHLSDIKYSL